MNKQLKKVLTLIAALGFSGAANAAWIDVYYELGNENSQSGNTIIPAAHVPGYTNTGEPVTTFQSIGGKATVNASASVGSLKTGIWDVSDVQSVALTGVSDKTWSHAAASWFDLVLFNPQNSALIGQTATVNASLLLTGSMQWNVNVFNNNSPYYDVSSKTKLSVSGTGIPGFVTAREDHVRSGTYGDTNVSVPAPSVIPVSFTVTLGSLNGMQYNLDLQGTSWASFGFRECGGGYGPCGAQASAQLTADYAHSLLWGGISSVTDANGNPIVLSSALGETGFNYMNAAVVPIPSTVWLFGSGLLGLVGVARRRARAATDGGATWSRMDVVPVTVNLSGVAATGSGAGVVAVGEGGTILRNTQGGAP